MARLSVVVVTHNEEKNIAACLESVLWADEIILVDGRSEDRTAAIAGRYPVQILQTENAPAETQRLKGIERVQNEWFFLLDADERVSPRLRRQIEEKSDSPGPEAAFYVLRRNYYRDRPVHLHHPDYQLRLFNRREADSLPGHIHRIPQVRGKTGRLDGELSHYFFTSIHEYLEKLNRYTEIEASYWQEEKKTVTGGRGIYYFLIRPATRFFQYYFLKKGFLDGFFGLFFSLSSAYYDVMVAAKSAQPAPKKSV